MRAGLLSEQRVIDLVNEKFVATWVLIDDLKAPFHEGHVFARTLAGNWEYPLDLMFLTSEGELVSKLNSFRDLPAHHDVGHPRHPFGPDTPPKTLIFYNHAMSFLQR